VKKWVMSMLMAAFLAVTTTGVPNAVAAKSNVSSLGTSYANCDALHNRWPYGVAKSRRAARRQVRTGHYKPHVSRAGYRANSDLDADSDGTACEVLK
jgi:Excalibur calcium-binding domain